MTTLFKESGVLVWQPFWANGSRDGWMTAVGNPTVPAGVTFQTTIPHPHASFGQQYVEIDCNNANHRLILTAPTAAGGAFNGSVRQAGQVAWIGQFSAANPTSDAKVWDNDPSGAGAGTVTYRELRWLANSKTLAFYAGATPTLIGTAVADIPATTDLQFEIIEVIKDAAGTALPNWQLVVRYSTLSAGAQGTVTTLINALEPTSVTTGLTISTIANGCFGENASKGGGKFCVGSVRAVGIDADAPPGISRVDHLTPNANTGHLAQWANNFLLVDDTATGVPDDATTEDSINYLGANTNKTQLYDCTAQHTAVGDTVHFVTEGIRAKYSGILDKGATNTVSAAISDGTTDINAISDTFTLSTSYQSVRLYCMDKPGGTGWDHNALTGIQIGHKGISSTVGSAITHYCTVDTLLVAYTASGETMPAVDAIPATRRIFVI